MSQESNGTGLKLTLSDDEGIPSMNQIATQLIKTVRRMKKHAETCHCCKEVLETTDGQ